MVKRELGSEKYIFLNILCIIYKTYNNSKYIENLKNKELKNKPIFTYTLRHEVIMGRELYK